MTDDDYIQKHAAALSDGGPAFPKVVTDYNPNVEEREVSSVGGMSLRDYFAAHAPEPPKWWMESYKDYTDRGCHEYGQHVAQWRYVYADAMLKERAK